jgi:hypothetical protein
VRLREIDIITPTLLRRFHDEARFGDADGRHYALILRDDDSLLSHHPFSPPLDPAQMIWATDVLKLLNRELHHDGAWVVVFTHVQHPAFGSVLLNPGHAEYGRYALLWLDADADPQFAVEWEIGCADDFKDFTDVLLAGIHSTAQKCEAAWTLWHHHMRDTLDLKTAQTFKRAKGERAPSVH